MFLKTSRLIKRRTIAREMCEAGRVLLNGREARPAKEVKRGDVLVLKYSSRIVELEVLGVLDGPSKKQVPPQELYRVTKESRLDPGKDLWSENLSS